MPVSAKFICIEKILSVGNHLDPIERPLKSLVPQIRDIFYLTYKSINEIYEKGKAIMKQSQKENSEHSKGLDKDAFIKLV